MSFDRCKRHDRYVDDRGCPTCAVEGIERVGRALPSVEGLGVLILMWSDDGLSNFWTNVPHDDAGARARELGERLRRPMIMIPRTTPRKS